MLRTFVLGTGALALGLGLAGGSGAGIAGAVRTPAQLSGAITCTTAGLVKFSPKLTNGGSSPEVIKLKLKLSGCSGVGATDGGVTLSGGQLTATTSGMLESTCGAVIFGSSLPPATGIIKWKGAGGPIAESDVTVSSEALFYNPSADTLQVFLGSTSVTSGSFDGESLTTTTFTSNSDAQKTTNPCGTAGLGSVKFGASGGTANVGAGA